MKEGNCHASAGHLCWVVWRWLLESTVLSKTFIFGAKTVRTDTLMFSTNAVMSNRPQSWGSFKMHLFPPTMWNKLRVMNLLCSCTSAFEGWRSVMVACPCKKTTLHAFTTDLWAMLRVRNYQAERVACRKLVRSYFKELLPEILLVWIQRQQGRALALPLVPAGFF